jgi:SAM-dependent methyltransferase
MTPNQAQISSNFMANSETLQRLHYERIAADYDVHYNDRYSQHYMQKFVLTPMFEGIEMADKVVLEAMCGGGQTAKFLLGQNAIVTGLDISPRQTANFKKRHPSADVLCGSILNSGIESDTFDIITVVGGIHHLPPNIDECLAEIHRILKPGGYFCFMEPHSESLAEVFRREWYRRDSLFADNEAAINMSELREKFADRFEFKQEQYLGNLAYLFVLNSLVFRIPAKLKSLYSSLLISVESILNIVLGKRFSCFVVAQWQKK